MNILPFVPRPSISPVQNNGRFERIALRNSRKREAHKKVLLCIPSSIPTPSSPLLLLSPLFFPPLLPLPAQASPASSTSYDRTDKTACTFCNPANVGINQKCMSRSRRKDSLCNTEGQREEKSKSASQKRGKKKLYSSKHAAGRKRERASDEEWERGCLACSSQRLLRNCTQVFLAPDWSHLLLRKKPSPCLL